MIDCGDGTPDTALLYLEAAIGILDSCSAPPEIAAHADLARARLGDWLVSLNAAGTVPDVFAGNAPQDFASH